MIYANRQIFARVLILGVVLCSVIEPSLEMCTDANGARHFAPAFHCHDDHEHPLDVQEQESEQASGIHSETVHERGPQILLTTAPSTHRGISAEMLGIEPDEQVLTTVNSVLLTLITAGSTHPPDSCVHRNSAELRTHVILC